MPLIKKVPFSSVDVSKAQPDAKALSAAYRLGPAVPTKRLPQALLYNSVFKAMLVELLSVQSQCCVPFACPYRSLVLLH